MRIFKNSFGPFQYRTYYITDTEDAWKIAMRLEKSLGSLWGLDIETAKLEKWKEHKQAGLDPHLSQIRLLQIYSPEAESVYVFDLFHVEMEVLRDLLDKGRFVAHHSLFEQKHLTYAGFPNLNIGCSMLLSQVIHGAEHSPFETEVDDEDDLDATGLAKYRKSRHSLQACVARAFGFCIDKAMQLSDWSVAELTTQQINYASLDSKLCYELAKFLEPKLINHKMVRYYKFLKDAQNVIVELELKGIPVSWSYHEKMLAGWEDQSKKALEKCKPYFKDINIQSGKMMSAWLETYLRGRPAELSKWPRTAKGAYSFSKAVIADFRYHPPIAALLDFKKWSKLLSTYGKSLAEKKNPVTGRLHSSFMLGTTTTGRLSSRNPNVQNFVRDSEFRKMFAAEKDHVFIVADYVQIEVRVQAELSQDPLMIKVYREDGDIYKTMASSLLGKPQESISKEERQIGKVCVLGMSYGMGHKKLAGYASVNYGVNISEDMALKAHRAYHSTFSTYSKWCGKMRDRATKLGYIETMMGKRRKLEEKEVYCSAPNTVVQGSSFECLMTAMLLCLGRIKGIAEMVCSVHDEVLLYSHKRNAEKVRAILTSSMNEAFALMFPKCVSRNVAEAKIGINWAEAK